MNIVSFQQPCRLLTDDDLGLFKSASTIELWGHYLQINQGETLTQFRRRVQVLSAQLEAATEREMIARRTFQPATKLETYEWHEVLRVLDRTYEATNVCTALYCTEYVRAVDQYEMTYDELVKAHPQGLSDESWATITGPLDKVARYECWVHLISAEVEQRVKKTRSQAKNPLLTRVRST
jgi:hypothetical protein